MGMFDWFHVAGKDRQRFMAPWGQIYADSLQSKSLHVLAPEWHSPDLNVFIMCDSKLCYRRSTDGVLVDVTGSAKPHVYTFAKDSDEEVRGWIEFALTVDAGRVTSVDLVEARTTDREDE